MSTEKTGLDISAELRISLYNTIYNNSVYIGRLVELLEECSALKCINCDKAKKEISFGINKKFREDNTYLEMYDYFRSGFIRFLEEIKSIMDDNSNSIINRFITEELDTTLLFSILVLNKELKITL